MNKTDNKINIPFTFLMKKEQHERLKAVSFYSGITIGKILRDAIDTLDFTKGKNESR